MGGPGGAWSGFGTAWAVIGIVEKELHGEIVRVRVCKREGCGQELDR